MATRSMISAQQPDGTFKAIYCHWNGDPSENGAMLRDHYTDPAKIDALLALGNLSELGKEPGEKPIDPHDPENTHSNFQCIAHHRDMKRPWEDCQPVTFDNEHDLITDGREWDIEFLYIWRAATWWVMGRLVGYSGDWGAVVTVDTAILAKMKASIEDEYF